MNALAQLWQFAKGTHPDLRQELPRFTHYKVVQAWFAYMLAIYGLMPISMCMLALYSINHYNLNGIIVLIVNFFYIWAYSIFIGRADKAFRYFIIYYVKGKVAQDYDSWSRLDRQRRMFFCFQLYKLALPVFIAHLFMKDVLFTTLLSFYICFEIYLFITHSYFGFMRINLPEKDS